jgi:hypothetical protein
MSMSKKLYFILISASILVIHTLFVFAKNKPTDKPSVKVPNLTAIAANADADVTDANSNVNDNEPSSIYNNLNLAGLGLSKEAFDCGMKGLQYLHSNGKVNNDNIISIVDFSLPSSKKRLFVIDLKNNKVLFHTYVSHGRNSGREVAQEFSNAPESFKSSLGFYVTGGTYNGKHGYSMQLNGEEAGFNDNALSRAIVMHSADYVGESIAKMQGYIGRSLGCPALSPDMYKPVIEKIKGGSCLFLYSPNKYYLTHSKIINRA